MSKTEVYSWRTAPEIKTALELEARREGASMAQLIDRITQEWLEMRRRAAISSDREQARLHAAAAAVFGAISGGEPQRSERARPLVRERLARRHDR
jgi:hypothetical protein